jgi:hypothetical protein
MLPDFSCFISMSSHAPRMKNKFLLTILGLVCGAMALPAEQPPKGIKEVTQDFAVMPDGTHLKWDLFLPATKGPWNVVLVIHAGGFRTGVRGPKNVAMDMATAGFVGAAIDYRLDASSNLLKTQPAPVYASPANPNQEQDIEAAVMAARFPTSSPLQGKVTGWVGVIGGSSGGGHALWVAATGTLSDWRANAAALLSGPYEFDDEASLNSTQLLGCDMELSSFRSDQTKYCHTSETNPSLTKLHNGSAIYQVQSDVSPIDMIATTLDPITPNQIDDLRDREDSVGATNYIYNKMDGCLHAYNYWDEPYVGANPPETVAQQVANFFLDQVGQ